MLCTSGFVDDVMFVHNVSGNAPLFCMQGCPHKCKLKSIYWSITNCRVCTSAGGGFCALYPKIPKAE